MRQVLKWVTFEGVALRPGEKTEVKVVVEETELELPDGVRIGGARMERGE